MSGVMMTRVRALLATARVANVPSVVSNVWVGAVVARMMMSAEGGSLEVGWPKAWFWCLAAAGVCLYVAGNFLNDWHDRGWDAENRPERALPSGLFRPGTYLAVALGLVAIAGACASVVSEEALLVAGVILVFVWVYTVLHKRTGWGVVWVGLCRALLVVLGGVSVAKGGRFMLETALVSIPLFCYIVGLSVSARFEAKGELPRWAAGLSLGLLALPMGIVWGWVMMVYGAPGVLPASVPYAAWMMACYGRRRHVPRYVAGLLAGIPLVDLMVLLGSVQALAGERWVISPVVLSVPLVAFAAGLLLQRVAPAS